MPKNILITGIIMAGLAVALGAFGAHGLKKLVPAESVQTFQTGVQYQMYHALALMILWAVAQHFGSMSSTPGLFFILGIILFSGSLYLIVALHAMQKPVPTLLGIATPIGGLCFILGWIFFLVAVLRK